MGNTKTKNKKLIEKNIVIAENNRDHVYKKISKHLICDDAYTNRLVLKKYLIMFGCDVDEAENGEEAINKVKANGEYETIWMDIKMPKMDGFECTENLRGIMAYHGQIIGLTGYVDDATIKRCINIGMDRVIAKPFDKKVIEAYIIDLRKTNRKNV